MPIAWGLGYSSGASIAGVLQQHVALAAPIVVGALVALVALSGILDDPVVAGWADQHDRDFGTEMTPAARDLFVDTFTNHFWY